MDRPTGPTALGQTVQINMSSEPGLAFYLAAAATSAPVATPFGNLLLDMSSAIVAFTTVTGATRVAAVSLAIPNSTQFLGMQIPLQSVGLSNTGSYRFTNATTLVISS